ncbi:MAG TPA: YihY/virulence factor BrkB family protein [Ignavibacteriaceae bacterium]|nr:YihY/virulence factor BrkB family protein [Ignavibacteriaceae bacterium]
MIKFKFFDRIKNSKLYLNYRKVRFFLFQFPIYRRFRNFVKHYFGGLYYRIDEHHVFLFSGGLAFSLFVCIVPFILIIFAVAGTLLDSTEMQFQISRFIDTIIPYSQYAEYVKDIIFARINEVIEYKNIAGLIGAFGLLFAASGLFSSMRTILNKIFGLKFEEPFLIGKLKDFALVLMVILIFFFSIILMPALDLFLRVASRFESFKFFGLSILEQIIVTSLSLLLIFVLFSILYFVVPKIKIGKKAVFIGALWASLLWEGAKQAFGYYIYNFGTLGKIYGTYALIVVVAFWIYYASIVFIIGAEIGKLYSERKYSEQRVREIIY